jgi:hypothetical protein
MELVVLEYPISGHCWFPLRDNRLRAKFQFDDKPLTACETNWLPCLIRLVVLANLS